MEMTKNKPMKTNASLVRSSIERPFWQVSFTFIAIVLVCFTLCQQVQSATDTPDPGGSLPVSNTADGHNALRSLTTGIYNSAFGFDSLLSLTDGKFCTGIGGGDAP
jgi:hypothetical protein